mmetsp:Transcript_18184/g.33617  ORF Transcript_18184/g.33617 Transcript_18184/m.33617 type:complete len:91 (-) Transcript_18184:224-496(-)
MSAGFGLMGRVVRWRQQASRWVLGPVTRKRPSLRGALALRGLPLLLRADFAPAESSVSAGPVAAGERIRVLNRPAKRQRGNSAAKRDSTE